MDFHPVAIAAFDNSLVTGICPISPVSQLIYELFHLFKIRKLKRQRRMRSRAVFRSFDEHRCIFVHIPKCAGLSVSNSLFQGHAPHLTLECYRSIFEPSEFRSYFKFAVVRNPWDRVVSAYHYLHAGGRTMRDWRWAEKNLSRYRDFDSFVRHGLRTFKVQRYLHFRPQSRFICTAKNHTHLDFIALFENLEHDFSFLCQRLNISTTLKQLNRTPGRTRDFRAYYTEETQRIVGEIYVNDITNLRYSFDNSSVPRQLEMRSTLMKTGTDYGTLISNKPHTDAEPVF